MMNRLLILLLLTFSALLFSQSNNEKLIGRWNSISGGNPEYRNKKVQFHFTEYLFIPAVNDSIMGARAYTIKEDTLINAFHSYYLFKIKDDTLTLTDSYYDSLVIKAVRNNKREPRVERRFRHYQRRLVGDWDLEPVYSDEPAYFHITEKHIVVNFIKGDLGRKDPYYVQENILYYRGSPYQMEFNNDTLCLFHCDTLLLTLRPRNEK